MDKIRITEIKIPIRRQVSPDEIKGLFRLADFLNETRHPDFKLHVLLDVGDGVSIENTWLYDMVSVLKSKIDPDIGIRLPSKAVISPDACKTIATFFGEVIFRMSSDYSEYNQNMAYFSSRKVAVVAELIVTPDTVKSLKAFKDFYSVMRIQSTYKIDYFSLIPDKKQFVSDVLEEIGLIVMADKSLDYIGEIARGRQNYCPSFEKSFTYHLNGNVTHCHMVNDLVLNKNSHIDHEQFSKLVSKIDLSKCRGCPAIGSCGGGCYAIIESGKNDDVFCAVNMGFQRIKNGFLNRSKQ